MAIIIACLSQKGGVGKSTLARLIARTYASAGWSVKICDFNTRQLTSVDWVALRKQKDYQPEILAQPYQHVRDFRNETVDLIVADGRPDSDTTSLEIARMADLCVIPTGLAKDDLKPQVMFCNELHAKGVPMEKLLLVLNKITHNQNAVRDARAYLRTVKYTVADNDLAAMHSYQIAQDDGLSVAETGFASLNEKADALASEIVDRVNHLQGIAA